MTAGNRHETITVAGFMGTGKSTVGQLVAARLDFEFVDTDAVIEARTGKTIAEIFASDGEPTFRALEAAVCAELVNATQRVIAVGGGALVNPSVQKVMVDHSLVICLTCDLDMIIQRVGDAPARPLFSVDREKLARLLASRAGHYASLPFHVNTTELSPEQAAEEVIRLWQQNS